MNYFDLPTPPDPLPGPPPGPPLRPGSGQQLDEVQGRLRVLAGRIGELPAKAPEEQQIRAHLAGIVAALGAVLTPGRDPRLHPATIARIATAAVRLERLLDALTDPDPLRSTPRDPGPPWPRQP